MKAVEKAEKEVNRRINNLINEDESLDSLEEHGLSKLHGEEARKKFLEIKTEYFPDKHGEELYQHIGDIKSLSYNRLSGKQVKKFIEENEVLPE